MRLIPFTTSASLGALTMLLGMAAPGVLAQEAAEEEYVEEVFVQGTFQRSLQSALDQKRDSASVIEAISAEDIGQLPDISITESLSRLPGVAQDRDRGNGSQISIRGMGGQLGLTTLNGREVSTVEEDRNVRYDQFPAELINAAQVYKTPQAKIIEGGVSGTVNLQTVTPLDHDERVIAFNARASMYELGRDIDDAANDGLGTRYSVSYIDKFAQDTLGVAIGLAGQSQPIATQRSELWNYGDTWHNTQQDGESGPSYNAPWGGSSLVRGGEDSRVGGMAVIQWKPSEVFSLNYDLFYSQLEISEEQRGFDFNVDSSAERQWVVGESVPTKFTNSDEGSRDVLSANVGLSSLRNLNEQFTQTDDMLVQGLNMAWNLDKLTLSADISHSATNRDRLWHTVRTETTHADPRATFDATGDRRMTFELAGGVSLTDPSQNQINGIQVQPLAEGKDALTAIDVNAEYFVENDWIYSFVVGARVSEREKSLDAQIWEQWVTADSSDIDSNLIIDSGSDSYWGDLPSYMALDREAVIDQYFGALQTPTPGDNDDLLASWSVDERISAAYVQLNFTSSLAGVPVTGNVGVRYVTTETDSNGHSLLGSSSWVEEPAGSGTWVEVAAVAEEVSVSHSYTDILPSLNLAFELSDDTVLRFAMAKTIARAPLDFLSPAVDIGQDQWGANPGESGSGNPKLEPFRATQTDLTYEWYFGESDSVAATIYYKDMDSYIARQAGAETIEVDGTEYSLSLPVNGNGGYIRGYELVYQQAFESLPGFMKGLGVYANYAYAESDIRQGTPLNADPFGLTGLSNHVGTVTLWHYLNGFESRLSYNYRSEFQRDINRVMGEEGVNASEGYMDLAFSYEVSEDVKVMLQIQNLTDEPYEVYGLESNNAAHINKYEEFGKRFNLGISWKI
ncbi:TonB-dependent receptor [Teredinibacter haidensis]|uniref:TonB-dependent receptor n=1 Tax=Teredinibacter haidensis TaxID=2731755 RepID=UPI00094905BF|nr:TonB-dependent receptor [Teredinibacter haidensis]